MAAAPSIADVARARVSENLLSTLDVPLWAWVTLAIVVLTSITTDLFVHRGDHVDSRKRAILWTITWIAIALGFNLFVALEFGRKAGEEFLAAYLLEKSLSVDNLFVFLLVFGALSIPRSEQHRVLTWGIFGAIVFRAVLIFAGAAAIQRWHALTYVFGGILLLAAFKLLREQRRDPEREGSPIVLWLERHLPCTRQFDNHRFITRVNGKRVATPLMVALIAIEITDVLFAIDSVPAAFAVTEEPFIIYASNLLAILGMRALYFVLAELLFGLRYLKYGLAAVLAFAGGKLLLASWGTLPPLVSVGIIATCITISVVASVVANRRDRAPPILRTGLQDPQPRENPG